jgi:hypothetical protein
LHRNVTLKDVTGGMAEIHVVGLACIVVGVEMTEVLQLLEALAVIAPNIGGEPFWHTVLHAGRALGAVKSGSVGERVKGGGADRSSPTQSGISKPKAPGSRGIETGTFCSIAFLIAGVSKKSHIITTRLTM